MAKITVDLPPVLEPDSEPDQEGKKVVSAEVKEIARALPDPHTAELRVKLRNRVQMNFPRIPVFIRDQFDAAAKKKGMTKVEFLYHCLRIGGGLEIPPYGQMDLRRS